MSEVSDSWMEEYWGWIAVALFLLITVDMLTSLFAAHHVGIEQEANPLMKWALEQGIAMVVAFNLLALGITGTLFYGLARTLDGTCDRWKTLYARYIECFVAMLLAIGLFIFANNLSVVVLGRSLVVG